MRKSKLHGTMSLLVATLTLFALATAVSADEFGVKEYAEFHDLLHPLQHDALPAKDFPRIRSNAGELVKRGRAIVRLGVPKGTTDAQVEEFRRELRKFEDALAKFSEHSQNGTDKQLEVSFGAVHDSFEMLAGMLPRKSN
jgi:hypothetical protein